MNGEEEVAVSSIIPAVAVAPTFLEQVREAAATAGLEGFERPLRDQAEIAEAPASEALPVTFIERGNLRESPTNPRKRWGDLEELAKTISKHGILQPLIVRPGDGGDGRYVIVSGHRRFRAGKIAGLNEFRCEVRELTDDQVFEIQVIENVQREDLHPMEEAEGYEMMRSAGYEVPTIAGRVGKSTGWVYARLKLLDLGPEGRAAFFEDRVELSVALVLGRQPQANQGKALIGLERLTTTRERIAYLQTEFARNLKGSPFDLKDATLPRLVKGGFELGDCVSCPNNSNNAPRELFVDYQKIEKAGVCSNTTCFAGKCAAIVERVADKARARGEKVLTPSETKKVISYGQPVYGSPFVIATDVVGEDPKRRTWNQIFERLEKEDRPAVVIAPNEQRPGEVYQLFDRREAMSAAAKVGAKWAKKAAPREEKHVKSAKAKAAKADDRARLIATVTELAMPRLVEALRKGATLTDLRPAALVGLDAMTNEERELVGGWFEVKALEKWVRADATIKDLIAFLVVASMWPTFQESGESFDAAFSAMAKDHKVDLQAMTRAQLEQAKADAAAKKGGK